MVCRIRWARLSQRQGELLDVIHQDIRSRKRLQLLRFGQTTVRALLKDPPLVRQITVADGDIYYALTPHGESVLRESLCPED